MLGISYYKLILNLEIYITIEFGRKNKFLNVKDLFTLYRIQNVEKCTCIDNYVKNGYNKFIVKKDI